MCGQEAQRNNWEKKVGGKTLRMPQSTADAKSLLCQCPVCHNWIVYVPPIISLPDCVLLVREHNAPQQKQYGEQKNLMPAN